MHIPDPPAIELWSALPTPFMLNGELDEAGLRHNTERCVAVGLHGVYCNGLMGEVWSLTPAERRRIVEIIADTSAGRLGVSPVTTVDNDLAETLALTRHAREVGAAYAVLVPPTTAASDAEVLAFFDTVLSSVDMPYVIFNPGTPDGLGCALSTNAFETLCTQPNVRILKTTANTDLNNALRDIAKGTGVRVSDPLEEHFYDNVVRHGQQLLYCDPEGYLYQTEQSRPIETYVALIQRGDLAAASRVFDSLGPLRMVYRKWIIGPLEAGVMPNAALKHWCEFIGMAGGRVRAPLTELAGDDRSKLDAELAQAFGAVRAVSDGALVTLGAHGASA